jgi:hypothetical protein
VNPAGWTYLMPRRQEQLAIPDPVIWLCRKAIGSADIPPGAESDVGRDH